MLRSEYQGRRFTAAVGNHPAGMRARGAVAVLVMVTLSLLLGFTALAIDSAYLYYSTAEMQVAVDSGALAGAGVLRQGGATAEAEAFTYAGKHSVAGQSLGLYHSGAISAVSGNWNGVDKTFVRSDGTETVLPNAVRVVGRRKSLRLFFAGILGVPTSNVGRDAVAVLGSGRCAGIWGLDGVVAQGSIYTDSYDSREGLYGEDNIYANGDICSAGNIDLSGTAVDIYGDAMYGEAGVLNIDGNPSVWGITGPLCCPVAPPTVDPTDAMFANDNNLIGLTDDGRDPFQPGPQDLLVEGTDNLTLDPGIYYFTAVRIAGQATLTVTGPTEIWVTGLAEFTGGGLVNVTADPTNLKIYSTGSDLILSGDAEFHGVIVAPTTRVAMVGSVAFHGVFIGQTVTISGNATVHVDEAAVEDILGVGSVSPVLVE